MLVSVILVLMSPTILCLSQAYVLYLLFSTSDTTETQAVVPLCCALPFVKRLIL